MFDLNREDPIQVTWLEPPRHNNLVKLDTQGYGEGNTVTWLHSVV